MQTVRKDLHQIFESAWIAILIIFTGILVAFPAQASGCLARNSLSNSLLLPLSPVQIVADLAAADGQLLHQDAGGAARQLASAKKTLEKFEFLGGAPSLSASLLDARLTLQLAERQARARNFSGARTNLFKTMVKLENAFGVSGPGVMAVNVVREATNVIAQMFGQRATGTKLLKDVWKNVMRWLVPARQGIANKNMRRQGRR